jgi:hypothetical protein
MKTRLLFVDSYLCATIFDRCARHHIKPKEFTPGCLLLIISDDTVRYSQGIEILAIARP